MRLPVALALLLPATAFANPDTVRASMPEPSRASMAEPSRHVDPRTPSETGQLRVARVTAPDPVAVDDGRAPTREHDVAPPHTVGATATDSDVVAELAAHQMKRHQHALDACIATAHKRAPAAAGNLTLDFDVADRKVKSVSVSDDGVHDAPLAACLTSAARGFTFSLAAARFRWPVAVRR